MRRAHRNLVPLALYVALSLLWQPTVARASDEVDTQPPSGEALAERRREAVTALASSLTETVRKHGADAVALQAALLMSSLSGGAVGRTEVTVVGPSPAAGVEFLRIEVKTGLVFDSDTTTLETCGDQLWRRVAAPALGRLESTDLRPSGLDLRMAYGTQSFKENFTNAVDVQGAVEEHSVRVAIPGTVLSALVEGEIGLDDLLTRSSLSFDD